MKRNLLFVIAVGLLTSVTAFGQEWSAEQLEVWEFEKACWQTLQDRSYDDFVTCFHEDYVGWYSANPVPMPFDETVNKRFLETSKQLAYDMTPHNIIIEGNVAIVHLSGYSIESGEYEGADKTVWVHWTDIAVKENGRWSWIADHGHPGPSF